MAIGARGSWVLNEAFAIHRQKLVTAAMPSNPAWWTPNDRQLTQVRARLTKIFRSMPNATVAVNKAVKSRNKIQSESKFAMQYLPYGMLDKNNEGKWIVHVGLKATKQRLGNLVARTRDSKNVVSTTEVGVVRDGRVDINTQNQLVLKRGRIVFLEASLLQAPKS